MLRWQLQKEIVQEQGSAGKVMSMFIRSFSPLDVSTKSSGVTSADM